MNPGDAANQQFVLNTVSASEQAAAQAQATPSTVNATAIEIDGIALSSANLSDGATLAKISQIPTTTSQLTNNSGFITAAGVPVQSVNGMTGAVNLGTVATATTATNVSGGSVSATTGSFSGNVAVGPTTLNQQGVAGRTDFVDVLADCGAQGAGASCTNSGATPYVVNAANCHDDYAAITACIANYPGRTILFPHTCRTISCIDYYSSQQIVLPHLSSSVLGTQLVGASRASGPNAQLVHIKFPSGIGGVFLYSYHGIENLWLEGSDTFDRTNVNTFALPTGFGGSGPAADGLVIGGRGQVRNVEVSSFARHCITADSTQTGGSDKTRIDHVYVNNCRGDGLNMNGTDSQVGTITNVSATGNQLYGVRANSAYGNTWIEVDTQQNHSPYGTTGAMAPVSLSGTISGIVCNGSTCVVTMTSSNTMYVDDYVTLAGISDATLNTGWYLTAVGANTFTFAATQNETLGAGGTASYNNGYRVWSAAGSVARGGGYNVPFGVLIDPYAEGNEPTQWDTFTNGSSAAIVIRPQGNLTAIKSKGRGPVLGAYYNFPTLNSLIDAPPASSATVQLNSHGSSNWGFDGYGATPIAVTNTNPAEGILGTSVIQGTYSALMLRRTYYGSGNNAYNGSNWWCWMLPGSYNTYLGTSSHCMADQLTDPLRSAIKGNGLSWFPNGLLLGDTGGYYTPTMFVGVGTAAPTTGNWLKGDLYLNSNPSVGGVWAWQCTTAGTPGTWTALTFGSTYTLPTATSSLLGGVMPDGTTITNSSGAISVTYGTTAGTAAQGNDSRITSAMANPGNSVGWLHNNGSGTLTWSTPSGTGTMTGTGITNNNAVVCTNNSATDLATCTTAEYLGPMTAPAWLRFFGDGSDGACTCTSGTCNWYGEKWCSSVNISSGAIAASQNATSLVIRSIGACTVAGTASVSLNTGSAYGGGSGGGSLGGGSGGGGGGGTAAGVAGYSIYSAIGQAAAVGGTAGAASGGAAGSGATPTTSLQHSSVSKGLSDQISTTNSVSFMGGSLSGSGGSSGGAAVRGGGVFVLVCPTISFTGAIDASGGNGNNAAANNTGAGGGGGGGIVVMAAETYSANTGTISVQGGTAGSCGSYTGCGAGGAGGAGMSKQFTIQ